MIITVITVITVWGETQASRRLLKTFLHLQYVQTVVINYVLNIQL